MYKLIKFVFFSLFILLVACGKEEISPECQEVSEAIEQVNLALDSNPYISADLAENNKKYYAMARKIYSKPGTKIKSCEKALNIYKRIAQAIKDAKSEEEVAKWVRWNDAVN